MATACTHATQTKLSNPHSFFHSYYALARCIISTCRVQPGVALKRYSLRPHPHCYHFHKPQTPWILRKSPSIIRQRSTRCRRPALIKWISLTSRPQMIIHRSTILFIISGRNFFKQGIISQPIQTFCYHVSSATTARVTDQG